MIALPAPATLIERLTALQQQSCIKADYLGRIADDKNLR
jgi:hypothetical protein